MILRNYQNETVECVLSEWENVQSTMACLPTGTGKTIIFCEIIRKMHPKRAIILAHRQELIYQAVNKLQGFGIDAEIEMADQRASANSWTGAAVIVSTVQTQATGNAGKGRMARFNPDDFGLVIADECHHFCSPQFRKVLDYYKQNPFLKILGVTATPDRADEQALGQIFDTVAYDYEILDAIHDGWLVPIEQQLVTIEGLDFSHIRTTAGDLNGADLAAIMEAEKNMQGIASSSIEIIGDKRALVFTASVKQAEMLSEIFNRHKSGMSDWVCGKTPKEDRRNKLQDFSSGKTQIMTNCGVLGEGFDDPAIEVVIQARPTKSRCLYSQQVGRATRPLPGVVDPWPTPEERKKAIAESKKKVCLIVDFVGNSGRHKLMTTADLLGGKVSDEVIERAVHRAKQEGGRANMSQLMDEEMERMKREAEERKKLDEARRIRLVGKAKFNKVQINPFNAFDLAPEQTRGWDDGKVLSEKRTAMLLKQGIDPTTMSVHQAVQLCNEMLRRWNLGLCTMKQAALLKKHGYETKDLKMQDASKLIDALAKNGWRRP